MIPRLYALLIGAFDAGHAAVMVTIAGQFAFFATARTLAEPLVLAALGCTLASRHLAACAALAAAAALHPLVAAPGIAVMYFWHALARPRLF